MWAEVVRAAAADAGATRRRAGRGRLASHVVYCMSWPYDDPAGRLAEALGDRARAHAATRASAARCPSSCCRRGGRADRCAGELDVARRRRRRGARHGAPAEEGGGAAGVVAPRSREAAVPVRGAVPPGRGRARGVPGVAHLRRPRRRAPGATSASRPTTTAGRIGDAAGADDRDRGRQPARLVPRGARRPTSSSTPTADEPDGRLPVHEDDRWRSWTSTWPPRSIVASHEAADRLGVPADRRVYLRGWAYATDAGLRRRAPRPVAVAGDGRGVRARRSRRPASASTTSPTSTSTRASRRRCTSRSTRSASTRPTTRGRSRSPAACPYAGGAGQQLPVATRWRRWSSGCATTRARSGWSPASACT